MVQGEHFEWELPEIYAGIYPLDKVIIEPSENFSDSINFDEDSLTLEFNGEAQVGSFMYIDIMLVNSRGDEAHYRQYALLSEAE